MYHVIMERYGGFAMSGMLTVCAIARIDRLKQVPKQTQQNNFLIPIALAIVCAAMYGRTALFDFINFRDTDFITDNPHIRNGPTLDGLRWAFQPHDAGFTPIAWISHMIDAQLFGLQAGMHHAFNVLLFAVATALMYVVLHRFTRAKWPSAFAALLFGVAGCGTVAWISQRGLLLGLVLGLLSLLVREGSAAMYALFLCAMLCSPAMIVVPLIHLLLHREQVRRIAPMFAGAVLLIFVRDPFESWRTLGPLGFATASGILLIAALGIGIPIARLPKTAALAVGALICAASAAGAWIETGYWQNSATLFPHVPTSYASLDRLGDSLRRDGHLPEAIQNLEAAIRLRPGDPRANRDFGYALAAMEQSTTAFRHLQTAVRALPGSAETHRDLALAYEWAEQFHDAELEFREAVRLDPALSDARAGIGFSLAEQGKLQEAKPFVEAAFAGLADTARLLPDDPYAHMNLGRANNFLGHGDEAIAELSTATHLHPDDPEPHYQLGLALAQRGRYNEAFTQFGPAARLAPDSAKIHFRLAEAFFQMGRRMEAVAHLEETLKLRPDYPGAREAYESVHRVVFGN